MYLHVLGLLMVALTTTNTPLITRAKFQVPIRTKRVYIHIRMIRPFMDIMHSILGRLKMAETGGESAVTQHITSLHLAAASTCSVGYGIHTLMWLEKGS